MRLPPNQFVAGSGAARESVRQEPHPPMIANLTPQRRGLGVAVFLIAEQAR
ncbi:hypothetical protein FJY63_14140 [Candidatus Sumerlaeota bacterium]|nr:hypothetical protein [Candidatus Sumerlaeota bacterium]